MVSEQPFLVLGNLVLHAAFYGVVETGCVQYIHLIFRPIVRVVIVRLCCRMLLESRMHFYLDPIW